MKRARIEMLDGKQSVWFWCAGCDTHHRIVTPGWSFNGNLERPTFHPSVMVRGTVPLTDGEVDRVMRGEQFEPVPLICHSFVRDGQIQYLDDCTHALKGQTVDLSPIAESMGAES